MIKSLKSLKHLEKAAPFKYYPMLIILPIWTKKLEEELAEYQADKSMEELADLLEVVYSVAEAKGCSVEQLESIRLEKAEKRGRFTKKLCLKEVSSHAETVE